MKTSSSIPRLTPEAAKMLVEIHAGNSARAYSTFSGRARNRLVKLGLIQLVDGSFKGMGGYSANTGYVATTAAAPVVEHYAKPTLEDLSNVYHNGINGFPDRAWAYNGFVRRCKLWGTFEA